MSDTEENKTDAGHEGDAASPSEANSLNVELDIDAMVPEDRTCCDCAGGECGGETASSETDLESVLKAKREQRSSSIKREAVEWAKSIVTALVLALLIKGFVVQAYKIPTGSMEPTIMPGDRVFGNRFVFKFKKPERGSIIAFVPWDEVRAEQVEQASYLKRIIAVENDVVEIKNGLVYVNGRALDEPYIKEHPVSRMEPLKVPAGQMFVMGDNRNNSSDSRVHGTISMKNIQARAFFRFWPLNRVGTIR